MKNYHIVIWIVVFLLAVGLSGCIDLNSIINDEDKFVGTWILTETQTYYDLYGYFTFFSDGTCSMSGMGGTYEIKNGKLVMEFSNGGMILDYDYSFSNNDTTLTLIDIIDGSSEIYTKQ